MYMNALQPIRKAEEICDWRYDIATKVAKAHLV